jgi:hypothetical protein
MMTSYWKHNSMWIMTNMQEIDKHAKGKLRPIVSLLPSCNAKLSIRGINVTSNYRKQLIRAYVEPEYIQYLQYWFEWPNETIEIIVCKCWSLAIQHINRDVLITKVCYDLLPTADIIINNISI